jgi:hypothetical protein
MQGTWREPLPGAARARRLLVVLLGAAAVGCGDDTSGLDPVDVGVIAGDAAIAIDAGPPDTGSALDAEPTAPDAAAPDAAPPPPPELFLQLGADVPPGPARRLTAHLRAASPLPLRALAGDADLTTLGPGSVLITIGDVAPARRVIGDAALTALGPEAAWVRSSTLGEGLVIAARGRPGAGPTALRPENFGVGMAIYALLEELGFAFLHPLAPTVPARLTWPTARLDVRRAPRWPIRGLQLHTMHPLELTDLLNGWGPLGPDDEAGWRAMLPEWERYLEWSVANGQNRVHWIPLIADSWAEFGESDARLARFRELVELGHAFGVAVGVDVPIALHQQHAWRMVTEFGDEAREIAQIEARVDRLYRSGGFDYLATENGTTEFTHPEDQRMLDWMNALARRSSEAHGKPTYVKIHASTGQFAQGFPDPRTGQPINFNFLPHFADPRLGVMPHTVQHYALDDPAPTYGNQNFTAIREFVALTAGSRETLWHPETAYWVSFDIDVPLFLPVYALRRVRDLRLLAGDEEAGRMGFGPARGAHMDGQLTFSSGWEWGYWLQEVVTARGSIDPGLAHASDDAALRAQLRDALRVFGPARDRLVDVLARMSDAQLRLLIEGRTLGVPPTEVVRRNGQAYLQGFEAFDDIADLAASVPGLPRIGTQPDRLGLVELRNPLHAPPDYDEELRPLLEEMAGTFGRLADELAALERLVPADARPLYDDMRDAARMTALRAQQIFGLYDYVANQPRGRRAERLADARAALDEAAVIVAARERAYRVPAERIAGWRNNPTAYEFTYLWTARSLYFWWRDEGKAVDVPRSPCYLNIINPGDVALGEGLVVDAARFIRDLSASVTFLEGIAECLAETRREPTFPQDGLRTRP